MTMHNILREGTKVLVETDELQDLMLCRVWILGVVRTYFRSREVYEIDFYGSDDPERCDLLPRSELLTVVQEQQPFQVGDKLLVLKFVGNLPIYVLGVVLDVQANGGYVVADELDEGSHVHYASMLNRLPELMRFEEPSAPERFDGEVEDQRHAQTGADLLAAWGFGELA